MVKISLDIKNPSFQNEFKTFYEVCLFSSLLLDLPTRKRKRHFLRGTKKVRPPCQTSEGVALYATKQNMVYENQFLLLS